jgi:hypothetical protein
VAFEINNKAAMEWVLRKIWLMETEIRTVEATSVRLLTRLKTKLRKFEEHFTPQLESWLRSEMESGNIKGRTAYSYYGGVQLRRNPERISISPEGIDESLYPEFVKVKTVTEFNRAEFIKHARLIHKETGVVLPGCVLIPESESLITLEPDIKDSDGIWDEGKGDLLDLLEQAEAEVRGEPL